MPGRRQPEDQAGDQRHREREDQGRQIDRHLVETREIRRRQREERRHAPARDDGTAEAGGERQHHALGEELADQAAASGADRRAHDDLAAARRGARQQQIGDVGAGDEQHEAHRAEQHEQRLPRRADDGLMERRDAHALVAVAARVLGGQPGGDAGHLRLGSRPAMRRSPRRPTAR